MSDALPRPVTPSPAGVHRFAHEAMATTFEVYCAHEDAAYARQAAHAAFAVVDRLEQDLSRFLTNSDVARINALRAGQQTRVSPATLEILELAAGLFVLTGGAFDVSIGTGLPHLGLDSETFAVEARAEGVLLDLGGIGKGYAVDRMADLLLDWGLERALVHGGFSSVLALEPPPDQDGWALTLSAPWPGDETVLARLSARRLALSASGTRKGAHIVDPRSGATVAGRAAWATVPGVSGQDAADGAATEAPPSCAAWAEGLSTAFMLLDVAEVEEICRRCPGVEAFLTARSPDDAQPPSFLHIRPPDRPALRF